VKFILLIIEELLGEAIQPGLELANSKPHTKSGGTFFLLGRYSNVTSLRKDNVHVMQRSKFIRE
jgi:hypothetical protein